MVRIIKQHSKSKTMEILSASEIGQYHYCSISWLLQKCGYKPKSPALKTGLKKHVELGIIIDDTKTKSKRAKYLAYVGYFLLIATVLIFFSEVVR